WRPSMSDESVRRLAACRTVAALLTPPGRGALATVRVHGPGALECVASLCFSRSRQLLAAQESRDKLWICRWRGPLGGPGVVHAESGNQVEINCHGGLIPVQTILGDLADRGVETVSWAELVRIEGAPIIEREALEALARAATLRTARILLDQYHGA